MRAIHLNGQAWFYVIGKSGVKIRKPQGGTAWVKIHVILGMTYAEWSKALGDYQSSRCEDSRLGFFCDVCNEKARPVALTPRVIKEYIRKNLT